VSGTAGSVARNETDRGLMTMSNPHTITEFTDRWGVPPQQWWLRGRSAPEPVHFDADTGIWNVHGYDEVLEVLNDPRTFSSDTK
jgi:hypothetical protein